MAAGRDGGDRPERCQEILNEEDLPKPDLPEDFENGVGRGGRVEGRGRGGRSGRQLLMKSMVAGDWRWSAVRRSCTKDLPKPDLPEDFVYSGGEGVEGWGGC